MIGSSWEEDWFSEMSTKDAFDILLERVNSYDKLLEDYMKLKQEYQPYIDKGIEGRLEEMTAGLRKQVNDWKGLAAFYKQKIERLEGKHE